MESRIWSEDDKRRTEEFMEEIERRLKIRRIFKSLESFIIMVNVIPPDHVDDVPVVEPNQHDDVPVVPEPIIEDEDEDPEEDEFEEEEDPQEEEDDMEVDIKEDENEPELTYPYEEVDPLNPPSPASESEPDDEIEVENTIVQRGMRTVPAYDGLLPGLMRRDINSLFGQMASLSRRLCGRKIAHALVEKKGKVKDEYYGKLILDLGNEVRSSVEQGMAEMEKLVENLGNAKDKVECKKLKKEFKETRTMPLKSAPLTQAAIHRMIKESVDAAIAAERARHVNAGNDARGSGPVRGQDVAPAVRECTFVGFMKCNPTAFHGTKGAVELRRWFEKTKSVFGISECAEGKKVKFAAVTLQGPSLTWWNAKVATMGLETVNQMPWTKMKQLMTAEFYPIEEVQRMEHELWNLKVKEYNIVAYTQRFNELALICPRMVEPERVKVDAYIRGLTDNIKGEVTSSKPANLNEAVRMAHKLMEQKSQAREERILEGKKQKWESFQRSSAISVERLGTRQGPQKVKQEEVGEAHIRAYAIKDVEPQGPNVVTGTFLLNNRYASVLFDSGSDRSFVGTRFSSMLNIDPVKIGACYEVELADGKVVSTNTILKGCTLNLVNHIFEIDLMPIELGTFGIIIGMDWLVKHDVVIVYGCNTPKMGRSGIWVGECYFIDQQHEI
ncbi:putative reverse transcriptase domain-containing protein [Tanacetum coccineum]